MKIVKKIWQFVPSLALALPVAVSAQVSIPGGTGLPGASVSGILTNTMNYLLYIVGILGVIGFVISGIFYLTAAGDGEQIKKAKSIMISSIIGVIVSLLGVIVMKAAQGLLGAQNTNF